MRHKIHHLNESEVIKLYTIDKLHCRQIAQIYCVSVSTIQRCLYKNQIKLRDREKRKYRVNERIFEKWSKDSAYIIGFLTADGYIPKDKRSVQIGISIKDIDLLEYIKYVCDSEHPIYHGISKKSNTKIATLVIGSTKIVKDLEKYNIIPQKTGKEKLPDIPDKYKSQYLLGLFDGDGCVSINKDRKGTNRCKFSICSSNKQFLENIKINLGFNLGNIYKSNNIFEWRVNKHSDIEKIYNFIYSNASYYYKRKREIFEKIIDYIHRDKQANFIGQCQENLIGMQFYSWTVIGRSPIQKGFRKKPKWRCRCKCGYEGHIDTWRLKNGKSKQCMICRKNIKEPNLQDLSKG